MTFQYKYIFTSDDTSIVEIEILNLPDNTPKHKKYHWLYIRDCVQKLNFISMKDNYRKFTEGELFMTDNSAIFNSTDCSVLRLVKKMNQPKI